MPTRPTTLTIDRADLAGAFPETKLDFTPIGLELLTPASVPKKRGNFGKIPLAALLQRADVQRKAKSGYNRTEWEFEQDTYDCIERGHEEVADDSERENYGDLFDYDMVLAMRGRRILALEQEIRIAALLHNTTTFPLSGNTGLDVTTVWSTVASSTPKADVAAAQRGIRARCGLTGDTLQISFNTWSYLSRSEEILKELRATNSAGVNLPTDAIARALGVKRVVVADMMYNSANQGLTETLSEVWSDSYAFLAVTAPGNDIATPCLGRTFVHEGDGGLLTVEQYRDEEVRGDITRTRQHTHEKIIHSAAGFLLKID